jgi:sensitive to high expression protein 9
VNDLLQRKALWTESDVSRFTTLVREDHALEQTEQHAKRAALDAEEQVEKALSTLTKSILARYHEEQVWSDKIRQLSTYGQLAVMGVNVLVFVIAILFVEPWKRRRLGETFERRVEALEKENRTLFEQNAEFIRTSLESQGKLLQTIAATELPPLSDETLQEAHEAIAAAKLSDEQQRRFETVVLSSLGGALGAGVAAIIIQLFRG